MIITYLEEVKPSKFKIYIDGDCAFLLYAKDIKRYHLIEGEEISFQSYNDILENVVYRRAKQKALAILKYMDRTEFELRKKLADADYLEDIIDSVTDYVTEYGYLDDERYTSSYVRAKKDYKSKRMIKTVLQQKGIKKELMDNILSTEYKQGSDDPEEKAIQRAIAKKLKVDVCDLSWKEKQKLMAFLYRKGFEIEKIKRNIE